MPGVHRAQDPLWWLQIGEADDGICGHPWLTWGLAAAADDASNDSDGGCNSDHGSGDVSRCADDAVRPGASALAPHQHDGFQRFEVSCVRRRHAEHGTIAALAD
jgi:hypothetical protein